MSRGGAAGRSGRARSGGRRTCRRSPGRETGGSASPSNPTTVPVASSSTTPPADGSGGVEHRQRRDRAVRPRVRLDERPQVEVGEVVGVARQEARPRPRPSPGWRRACRRCRAGLGSKNVRTRRAARVRAARWRRTTSGRWCRLTSTSSTPARPNASSQMSSSGLPPMASMHFGVVSVIGRSRVPSPRRAGRPSRRSTFRTTPRARIRAFGLGQHPVEAVHALEPRGVRRHRLRRRAPRLPSPAPGAR